MTDKEILRKIWELLEEPVGALLESLTAIEELFIEERPIDLDEKQD